LLFNLRKRYLHRKALRLNRWPGIAAAVTAAIIVGGCGSSENNTSDRASADGSAGVEHAKAQIARFSQVPEFTFDGAPFDASKAKGKTVFNIPSSSQIPFLQVIDKTMAKIAKSYGINFIQYANSGQPSEWAKGIDTAIARKVDAITLEGGPYPMVLQPQLKRAKAAGIPVLLLHNWPNNKPDPPNVDVNVTVDFELAGRLMADAAIAESNGKANVLVLDSEDLVPADPVLVSGIKDELAKHCPDCKVTVKNVGPVSEWSTKPKSVVQSALIENPATDWIIAVFDALSLPASAGVRAAGKGSQVKIATYNGSPFALKMIQENDIIHTEIGESLDWLAHSYMDQTMRVLTGTPPAEDERAPFRVFNPSNISDAGTPPEDSVGYGDAYLKGYRDIWAGKQ